jgi:PPM family protein phosphatase
MKLVVGAASDIGQVREGNEDSFLLADPLFAVADGMGGHRGGEVASELALRTIEELFAADEGSLTEQVERANSAVFERSQTDRDVSGMGTTLTAALVEDARVRLAHVGDSRAYLLRDGRLHLLTEDHTLVHRMVQEGEITEAQAETHPHRSILTRALGVDPAVQVDERYVEVRAGDRLLLCTDGLTGMIHDGQIESVLETEPNPQEAVERLVREANRAGGVDNITAVLLDVADDPSSGVSAEAAAAAGAPSDVEAGPEPSPPTTTRVHVTAFGEPVPQQPGSRHALRAALYRAAVALAAFLVVIVGLRVYLDSQWFVGVSNGRVAVFRGIPATVGGLDLNSVVVETTIPAAEAEALAFYRDLPDGITTEDRAAAEDVVERIRRDVDEALASDP